MPGPDFHRQVARTEFSWGYISTVELPPAAQCSGHLYETMVFGGPLDADGDYYETRLEALRGHQRIVDRAIAASS